MLSQQNIKGGYSTEIKLHRIWNKWMVKNVNIISKHYQEYWEVY